MNKDICPFCGSEMEMHVLEEAELFLNCKVCGKYFASVQVLQAALKISTSKMNEISNFIKKQNQSGIYDTQIDMEYLGNRHSKAVS